jgi:ribonuclease HI
MGEEVVLHFDGACEPNPGRGAWGWTLDVPGRGRVSDSGECVGRVTNNVAEYTALGMGLRYVLDHADELSGYRLVACGDAQMVIKQVRGEWQCHNERLAKLLARVLELGGQIETAGFPPVVFQWVPREANADADGLSIRAWEAAAGRTMPVRVKATKRWLTPPLFDDTGSFD